MNPKRRIGNILLIIGAALLIAGGFWYLCNKAESERASVLSDELTGKVKTVIEGSSESGVEAGGSSSSDTAGEGMPAELTVVDVDGYPCIGYLTIPSEIDDYEDVFAAASVATRILGYVNAPSLQQRVIMKCINEKTDISYYDRNRNTLYEGLTGAGFTCLKPEGAFYLFMKTPTEDDKVFVAAAKKYHILVVPGSSFGCPGYVRIAYCVAYETIVNSLPKFAELARDYGL